MAASSMTSAETSGATTATPTVTKRKRKPAGINPVLQREAERSKTHALTPRITSAPTTATPTS